MFFNIRKKELDLLDAYYRHDEPSKALGILKICSVPLILLFVFGLSYLYFYKENNDIQAQINDVYQEIAEYDELIEKTDKNSYNELLITEAEYNAVAAIDQMIKDYPEISSSKINYVQQCLYSDMQISSINYTQSSNALTVSFKKESVLYIEDFVASLKANTEYTDVIYNGYRLVEEPATTTSNTYTGETENDDNSTPATTVDITTPAKSYFQFSVVISFQGKVAE